MEHTLSSARHFPADDRGTERDLIALSFKVPRRFRYWFKTQAAIRNVTMTDLLMNALVSFVESNPVNRSDHREVGASETRTRPIEK